MAGNRDRRKHERTRAAGRAEAATPSAAGAAQQMTAQVAAAVAEAAAPHLAATGSVVADDATVNPAAAADAVRSLALHVMQRSSLHGRHACVAGCACCCHTAVTVAPPEVFAIARHLRATLSADELAALRERLDENAARAAGCTREAYIAALVPCGLLTADGNCRAHAVRPLACAGFLSTSRAACEGEFRRDAGRAAVPTDRFTMLVGLGASHGLRAACTNARLDGEFYELHHALCRVLDMPDGERRWAAGEPVFDGCLK